MKSRFKVARIFGFLLDWFVLLEIAPIIITPIAVYIRVTAGQVFKLLLLRGDNDHIRAGAEYEIKEYFGTRIRP